MVISRFVRIREISGLFACVVQNLHYFAKNWMLTSLFGKRTVPKGLPFVEKVEQVSTRTFRLLGLNPGAHTLQGTNTYLIGKGPEKILVDSGEISTSAKYVSLLFDEAMPSTGTTRISRILLTHGHSDHTGGVAAILTECTKRGILPPTVHKRMVEGGDYPVTESWSCNHIAAQDTFQPDADTTLRAVYTPGHTDDHVAFILEEDAALLAGDCVLGCGTSVFDDLHSYMDSLYKLRELMLTTSEIVCAGNNHHNDHDNDNGGSEAKDHQDLAADSDESDYEVVQHESITISFPLSSSSSSSSSSPPCEAVSPELHSRLSRPSPPRPRAEAAVVTRIYPGHGPVVEHALHKVDEYIAHRNLREDQLIAVLTRVAAADSSSNTLATTKAPHPGVGWVSSWDLVTEVYGNIPFVVKLSAHWNLSHHLEKLSKDGLAETRYPEMWRLVQK